jgi:hypothetical protein
MKANPFTGLLLLSAELQNRKAQIARPRCPSPVLRIDCYLGGMDHFPRLPHQSAGGIECCGNIVPEEVGVPGDTTVLRCNECGLAVGTINTGILMDLVNLALATEMDSFIPDADHINALPGPLRRYIHDLETRADPAGDVAEIALLKENNAALWARVHELEAQMQPPAS